MQSISCRAVTVSDGDLCVLLSISPENALHACQPLAQAGEERLISAHLRFVEKTGKFFLCVTKSLQSPGPLCISGQKSYISYPS